jgi:hypothetical protein
VSYQRPACASCGVRDRPLSACGRCHKVQYCNKFCQAAHWKGGHKLVCYATIQQLPQKKEAETTSSPSTAIIPSNSSSLDVGKGKKKILPMLECGFCGAEDSSLKHCASCMLTFYCNKACQTAHWKEGHKRNCISPDLRRPESAPANYSRVEGDECAICLEILTTEPCTLPCSHAFHADCVAGLRKLGVAQVCPLCRSELSSGPGKLHDEAVRRYHMLCGRVERSGASWGALTKGQQREVDEVLRLWREAADKGHAAARFSLGVMYHEGQLLGCYSVITYY